MRSVETVAGKMTEARRLEVRRLLEAARVWAFTRSDVRGLALVGSWACGTAHMGSDVDLVLLTFHVASYAQSDDWIRELGAHTIVRTASRGPLIERHVRTPSGLALELGIAPPHWASIYPVDPGTRRVVAGGMRVLHDPDGLLRALVRVLG